MNIVILSTFLGHEGGAEVSIKLFINELIKRGHEVTTLTANDLNFFNKLSSEKKAMFLNTNLFDFILAKKIERALITIKPDIVHVQDLLMLPAVVRACRKLKIPRVMTLRDHRFVCNLPIFEEQGIIKHNYTQKEYREQTCEMARRHFKKKWLGYVIYPFIKNRSKVFTHALKSSSVVAVCDYVKNNAIKSGVKNIRTIYNLAPEWSGERVKHKGCVALSAGRIVNYKGTEVLVKAMHKVKDVKLIIAGDGPDKSKLEKYARDNNLDIEFTGWVDYAKAQKLFSLADIVVIPSIWPECLSRITYDAYQSGAALITTDTGGNPEMVDNNSTGLIVKKNDAHALANAIIRLAQDPILRKRFAQNAKAKLDGHNGRMMEAYIEVYNGLT